MTGDGKTIVRGNYARYYDGYTVGYDQYCESHLFVQRGHSVLRQRKRRSTGHHLMRSLESVNTTVALRPGPFDQAQFDALKRIGEIDSAVTDEFVVGFEREVVKDLALYVSYTHRNYDNFTQAVPFGVTAADYAPAGVFNFSHPDYGNFSIPYSDITFRA